MPKYKVLPNNEIQYGIKKEGGKIVEKAKVAKAGDVLELSEAEAAPLSHAIEKVGHKPLGEK